MNKLTIFLLLNSTLVKIDCLQLQYQCELTPLSVTGPFYLDNVVIRRNLQEYRPGIPFQLTLRFTDANTCEPIPELWVIMWSCDALGYYSGYTKYHPEITYPSAEPAPTSDNSTFLRGAQQTDENGIVQFNTVVPG